MAHELDREPDHDLATRKGEFAMLIYSVGMSALSSASPRMLSFSSVGVIAGTILPHLANRDRRLLGSKSDVDENSETARLRQNVRQWKIDAARQGKPLKLPAVPFLLRNIWSGAMFLYAFLTFTTFFIETVTQVKISSSELDHPNLRPGFLVLGDDLHQPRWHLLGSCNVGPVHDHHGGT
jgi:solute carrier family 45 protein 1/2/4